MLLRTKETLRGKDIIISIALVERKNHINAKLANPLFIPDSNIIERINLFDKKQYEINDLQLNIGDYTFISQFNVSSLCSNDSEIILGLPWIETLGTFILNTK